MLPPPSTRSRSDTFCKEKRATFFVDRKATYPFFSPFLSSLPCSQRRPLRPSQPPQQMFSKLLALTIVAVAYAQDDDAFDVELEVQDASQKVGNLGVRLAAVERAVGVVASETFLLRSPRFRSNQQGCIPYRCTQEFGVLFLLLLTCAVLMSSTHSKGRRSRYSREVHATGRAIEGSRHCACGRRRRH